MAEYAKRSEVTIDTMGKVHNPSGEGIRAVSAQVQAKAAKQQQRKNSIDNTLNHPHTQPLDLSTASTATSGSGSADDDSHHGDHHHHHHAGTSSPPLKHLHHPNHNNASHHSPAASALQQFETKVKEGTAKRNITRKKSAGVDTGHYNSTHKKQGGHGKGQWKAEGGMMDHPTAYYYDEDIPLDEKDPLYDIEVNGKFILSSCGAGGANSSSSSSNSNNNSAAALTGAAAERGGTKSKTTDFLPRGYDPETSKAVYGPMLTECEFKHQVMVALQEYFDSSDSEEFIRTLSELKCEEYAASVVKKSISVALDKGPRERESVSRLLTVLHPTPLADKDMEQGFSLLLDSLDDLQMDVPEANNIVACFLARAVVDEVLPPAYLIQQKNHDRPGCVVVEKAMGLLTREHSTARLERIWGPGDGRSVAELKAEMKHLLQEYLLSRELDEAARCVKELDCTYFHHELVKRGIIIAMELEGSGEENLDAMAALFGFLVRNAIVSEHQIQKGLSRMNTALPDIVLDVPTAPELMKSFEGMLASRLSKVTASA